MTAKTVNIIRIDYELANKPDFKWIANIAAYSDDEAIQFLRKKLGNIKIISIERKSRLDAITDEVEDTILKAYKEKLPKENDENPKAKTVKKIPKENDENPKAKTVKKNIIKRDKK